MTTGHNNGSMECFQPTTCVVLTSKLTELSRLFSFSESAVTICINSDVNFEKKCLHVFKNWNISQLFQQDVFVTMILPRDKQVTDKRCRLDSCSCMEEQSSGNVFSRGCSFFRPRNVFFQTATCSANTFFADVLNRDLRPGWCPLFPKSYDTGALAEQRAGGSHNHSFGDESPPTLKNHGILEHLETVVVHSVGRMAAKTKV